MSDTLERQKQTLDYFPAGEEYDKLLDKRTRRGVLSMQLVLLSALVVAVLALAIAPVDDHQRQLRSGRPGEPGRARGDRRFVRTTTRTRSRFERPHLRRTRRHAREPDLERHVGGASSASSGSTRTASSSRRRRSGTRCVPKPTPRRGVPRARVSIGNVRLARRGAGHRPDIIAVAHLWESVTDASGFEERVARTSPNNPSRYEPYTFDQVQFPWRAWFSWKFITSPAVVDTGDRRHPDGDPRVDLARHHHRPVRGARRRRSGDLPRGVRPAESDQRLHPDEHQQPGRRVPSIIYGMLGLAIFVRVLRADHLRFTLRRLRTQWPHQSSPQGSRSVL